MFSRTLEEDQHDYGTDIQLEARHNGAMTNLRVPRSAYKGIEDPKDEAGVVRVEVQRKNLNYLLNHPHSLYVCYHLPTYPFLARDVCNVYCEYEHRDPELALEKTITVKLTQAFDSQFQERLCSPGRVRQRGMGLEC